MSDCMTVSARLECSAATHKNSADTWLQWMPVWPFISLTDSWCLWLRHTQTHRHTHKLTHRLIGVCCPSSWLALWKGHLTKPLTRRCNTCVCSDLSDTKKDIYGHCHDRRSSETSDWLDCRLAWRMKSDTNTIETALETRNRTWITFRSKRGFICSGRNLSRIAHSLFLHESFYEKSKIKTNCSKARVKFERASCIDYRSECCDFRIYTKKVCILNNWRVRGQTPEDRKTTRDSTKNVEDRDKAWSQQRERRMMWNWVCVCVAGAEAEAAKQNQPALTNQSGLH